MQVDPPCGVFFDVWEFVETAVTFYPVVGHDRSKLSESRACQPVVIWCVLNNGACRPM
jgi:hypothetical protein